MLLPAGESMARLREGGWSVKEVAVRAGDEKRVVRWIVSGSLGENLFRVEGSTRKEAWHRALKMAEASGKLDGKQGEADAACGMHHSR